MSPKTRSLRVYLGTYTSGESEGIYACLMDRRTGALGSLERVARSPDPSFLALHPGGRWLFAANELEQFEGRASGAVSAFAIDAVSGRLHLLGQQPSHGTLPCHLIVDPTGRHVLVASYGSGTVAVLPILADGSAGHATGLARHSGASVHPERQRGPHAHSVSLDRSGRFALCADLGTDEVRIHRFDPARGTLTPHAAVALAPGAGPRQLGLDPAGRHAWVVNELDSTLTALRWDAERGELAPLHTLSSLPRSHRGVNHPAHIEVSGDGRFVYASNRGHDSLLVLAVDPASGRLGALEHVPSGGEGPRHFALDPSGRFLLVANQQSDRVVAFRVDPRRGTLEPTGHSLCVPSPVCVAFAFSPA